MKKRYLVGVLFLGLLAGCGSEAPLQSEYDQAEEIETGDVQSFAKYLRENNYLQDADIYLGAGSSGLNLQYQEGDTGLNYTNLSAMAKSIKQAYLGGEFHDYKPTDGEKDEVHSIDYNGYIGRYDGDSKSENFCKELEALGIKNIARTFLDLDEKQEFLFVQDGIRFDYDSCNVAVTLEPNQGCTNAWKEYVLANVSDGFVVGSAYEGGLYNRLVIVGSRGEAGCKYSKRITLYAKKKQLAYGYIDFFTNDSGDVTFMKKEKATMEKVLASLGASAELAGRFIESCSPDGDGEVNLGKCKGSWSEIPGGYRLMVKNAGREVD